MTRSENDAEIIRGSIDHGARFGAISDRRFSPVHRYLARRTGRDAADELAGEVFRIAFENRQRVEAITVFGAGFVRDCGSDRCRSRDRLRIRPGSLDEPC